MKFATLHNSPINHKPTQEIFVNSPFFMYHSFLKHIYRSCKHLVCVITDHQLPPATKRENKREWGSQNCIASFFDWGP